MRKIHHKVGVGSYTVRWPEHGLTAESIFFLVHRDRSRDDEPAGVSNGVAVRPSRRTEGCSEDACCSFPAGPVAALAAGDGERQGGPSIGAV